MRLFAVSSLCLLLSLTACQQNVAPPISHFGFATAGVVTSATATQSPTPTPTPEPDNTVKQVRLRDVDGQKVFEYLDPNAATETWVSVGTIEIIPKGTQLHHWGPAQDVAYWSANGIRKDDIDRAVRSYDGTDVMGGGFYASKSTTDSADYGDKLLIVEPKHDLISLSGYFNYDPEHEALQEYTNTSQVLIPVSLVAEAGVETIRYTQTWMVCIRGEAVENVFEGSWSNLLKHLTSPFDFQTFNTFARKYPLTKDVEQSAEFDQAFPAFGSVLAGEEPSDESLSRFSKEVTSALTDGSFQSIFNLSDTTLAAALKILLLKAKGPIVASLHFDLDQILTSSSSDMMNRLKSVMDLLNLQIGDVFTGAQTFVATTPVISDSEISLSGSLSSEHIFGDNLIGLDLYKALRRLLNGNNTPWVETNDYSVPSPVRSIFYVGGQTSGSELLLGIAKAFDPKVAYRDQPQSASGDDYFDDKGNGYFIVTNEEKRELESNSWIVPSFKSVKDKTGSVLLVARYEYPSAQNYKHFANKLQGTPLLSQLQAAERAKQLTDPKSAQSRQLTVAIVKMLADQALVNGYVSSKGVFDLLKIRPLSDEVVNRLALQCWFNKSLAKSLVILNPSWEKAGTSAELLGLALSEDALRDTLTRTLQSAWAYGSDFSKDIGLWELAANQFGPHKDNQGFIDKVSARFKAADVQDWIDKGDNTKVYRALHEAGAD